MKKFYELVGFFFNEEYFWVEKLKEGVVFIWRKYKFVLELELMFWRICLESVLFNSVFKWFGNIDDGDRIDILVRVNKLRIFKRIVKVKRSFVNVIDVGVFFVKFCFWYE